MEDKAETRARILDAAMRRIKHYGYAKTTIAEIAADCAMSPGNIYRFFEGKIDIAEAMARQYFDERHARSLEIAADQALSARTRVRDIYLAMLQEGHALASGAAKILDVADVIHRERPGFAEANQARERALVQTVLAEGVERSELRPEAGEPAAARALQLAVSTFRLPWRPPLPPLETLEADLDAVLTLVFEGLEAG